MSDKAPFAQPGSMSSGAMSDKEMYGEERPHDGAPAGRFFSEAELPVSATQSKPARLDGFRPTAEQQPMPAPGSNEGEPKVQTLPRR